MKRVVAVCLVALALTGCYQTNIKKMTELKADCESSGGVFEYWQDGFGGDQWRCDLTTQKDEQ